MDEIRVPKLNTNDSAYVLTVWLVRDGGPVRAGEVVAEVETSKTVEELVSEHDGVLTHLTPAGRDIAPGDPIARVALPERTSGPPPLHPPAPAASTGAGTGDGPLVTAPAQALIDELGVDPERVRALPVKVVRRADVERLAAGPAHREGGPGEPGPVTADRGTPTPGGRSLRALSGNQRAVGRTVSLSHQTVPAAYTAVKVDVGRAVAAARDLTRRLRRLVGLPDLLISAVARRHRDFPLFFATLVGEGTAGVPESPHVGVTIDLGAGLYVPVIRDADTKSVGEIAGELAAYRKLAQRGGFKEEQLAGGTIVVTLHHDADVVMAVPIVFPGQACAVALTSPQREGERTVAVVGLSYDHRLINGRDAVLFLQALKETLEGTPSEGL
ncbi:pyruvate dehydrogenase [Nonomuraea mesophila]|uniref:Dihydrolipoamide acetyltransferase component of pyruvate dehydrogenase complex n=1 Tax=Nonomuraea mesophila TaxID=2530382 RepID=A0A4V2Z5H1_9ACTN|nr:2-oxo acid dehydrogenase subunit E2 [Nonomuraea mesophila]TDE24020.1 pyruvate dehydrogenase [Nonomuraea mesophila]